MPLPDLPERVAGDVHLAALPRPALEVLPDRVHQATMIVAGDEPHPVQAAVLEAPEETVVRRFSLGVRHVDREQLAQAVLPDALHHQHALADELTSNAHVLVASIDDQVRVGDLEPARSPRRQIGVQITHQAAHGALAERRPAQRFGDVADLPRADALQVGRQAAISISVPTSAFSLRW